jgi:hypothetical protein
MWPRSTASSVFDRSDDYAFNVQSQAPSWIEKIELQLRLGHLKLRISPKEILKFDVERRHPSSQRRCVAGIEGRTRFDVVIHRAFRTDRRIQGALLAEVGSVK